MLINQFNNLRPGQTIEDSEECRLKIVKKEQGKRIGPVFLPVTFGGYEYTMKTEIAGSPVFCTATTDRGDPDFTECEEWIAGCEIVDTLGEIIAE